MTRTSSLLAVSVVMMGLAGCQLSVNSTGVPLVAGRRHVLIQLDGPDTGVWLRHVSENGTALCAEVYREGMGDWVVQQWNQNGSMSVAHVEKFTDAEYVAELNCPTKEAK